MKRMCESDKTLSAASVAAPMRKLCPLYLELSRPQDAEHLCNILSKTGRCNGVASTEQNNGSVAFMYSCFEIHYRHINGRRSEDIVGNEYRGNDYIGCQDIALPQAAGCSSHTQNIEVYGQSSSNNTNTQSNNVHHNETKNTCSDEYAMVDLIAETSFSSTIHKTGTVDSFLLVEPTVTGLNRTELSSGYEFGKPVMNTENKIDETKLTMRINMLYLSRESTTIPEEIVTKH
ncbi:Hypothetical predicted protein [Mytilus galloprovincialis]|uniref:Uncharacterized protein n=1 Tax=Mytilus galloprovincialis TaxID=29158 RepID=A0A8B6FIA3_MYTGA|nr:Hypothetical predicted protein [Mytilus galloprovincialis]